MEGSRYTLSLCSTMLVFARNSQASALAAGSSPYPDGPTGLLLPGCLLQGDRGGQGYALHDRDT